ncbi:MAG: DUF5655 domain-containing protein [Acidobacteriota bacterium]
MNKGMAGFTIKSHFDGRDPVVRDIYDRVVKSLKRLGPLTEDPKKTSIHIVNRTALAGVATRKGHLVLTIKSDRRIASPRIHKSEQTSASRFHHEVKLKSPTEVDDELVGWLEAAYALSA